MQTCTWAPTVFRGMQLAASPSAEGDSPSTIPQGADLTPVVLEEIRRIENLGLSHLLIAQRWWGSGREIEGSSLDCLAMTAFFAAHTTKLRLVTAIHPGFFQPSAIAKWGATIDQLTGGRWAINVTSGWNLTEFDMYGIDKLTHDARYARSTEFIEVLRGAWEHQEYDYQGNYYSVHGLRMEPRPTAPLEIFQGGQSDAAIGMAAAHSDWMFLNGGPPERIAEVIDRVRKRTAKTGRTVRFALYAKPLCRATDAEAWQFIDEQLAKINPAMLEMRRERIAGAEGMWGGPDDPMSSLDTNEGYAARLIGSPDTVLSKIEMFREIGIEMLHLDVHDALFQQEVLPTVHRL